MTGVYASANLKKKWEFLKDMEVMLNIIENLVKYKHSTVYEIFSCLKNTPQLKKYAFINEADKLFVSNEYSFSEGWNKALSADSNLTSEKEDIELISSIGDFLGKNELEGQLASIAYLKSILNDRCISAENVYLVKGKLYRNLGVLSGALIVIMLM